MSAPYWYLSYADETGFRGACQVQAESEIAAAAKARQLGISPGGEVAILGPLTAEMVRDGRMPINVLLTKEQIEDPISVGELRDQGEPI